MAGLDLRHGDCLDLLRDIPDASVDCVLTDPPYASGGISLRERQQRTQTKYKLNNVKKVYPEFFGDAKDQRGWLACIETGRSFIGMELSRPYYEISRRRLEPLAQHYIIEADHA